jgi:hypothetical protein
MPYGDPVSLNRPGDLSQEGITHLTGCFFQGKTLPSLIGFDITPFDSSWQVQLPSQVGNVPGVSLSISPTQLMVKMSHVQAYTQFLPQPDQDVEQANRIGASGYSYHQLLRFRY